MTCQEQRHQEANKQTVIHHFRQLISKALIQPKQRILTKTPSQEKEQRLTQKKLNSTKKQNRKTNIDIS